MLCRTTADVKKTLGKSIPNPNYLKIRYFENQPPIVTGQLGGKPVFVGETIEPVDAQHCYADWMDQAGKATHARADAHSATEFSAAHANSGAP
jgi:hypothetical protein